MAAIIPAPGRQIQPDVRRARCAVRGPAGLLVGAPLSPAAWILVAAGVALSGCGIDPVERYFYSVGLEVSPKSIPADGVSAATLRVGVEGPDLERVTVRLHSTLGVLGQTTAALDEQGETQVKIYAPENPGAAVVTASVDREAASAAITFTDTAAGQAKLALSANPAAIPADGKSESAITAKASGVADGTAIAFSTTGGTLVSAGTTLAKGQATVRLRASTTVGTVTVSAKAGTLAGETKVQLTSTSGPQFDLAGTWGQLASSKVKLTAATLVPNPQDAVSPTLQLVTFSGGASGLTVVTRTCDVKLASAKTIVGTVTTTVPPALVSAIPVVTQQGKFLSSDQINATYKPSTFVLVMGAKLTNPVTDALPKSETDPRVVDDDKDGRPGVTVQNSLGGDQNVVFRLVIDTTAKVLSSTSIKGTVLAKTETQVFGIGNAFVPAITPLSSPLELVRVDGKHGSTNIGSGAQVSCADLIKNASTLFAP